MVLFAKFYGISRIPGVNLVTRVLLRLYIIVVVSVLLAVKGVLPDFVLHLPML